MKPKKSLAPLLLLLLALPGELSAQTVEKTLRATFRYETGSDVISPACGDNGHETIRIRKTLLDDAAASDGVTVTAVRMQSYSSPEGVAYRNTDLARRRATNARDYVAALLGVPAEIIESTAAGEDWDGFASFLSTQSQDTKANKALEIIGTVPARSYDTSGKLTDSRKRQLMLIDHGRFWNDMKETVFPALRRTEITITYELTTRAPEPVVEKKEEEQPQEHAAEPEETKPEAPAPPAPATPARTRKNAERIAIAGIYTNVPLDVFGAYNFGIEVPFARRLSLLAEVYFPRHKDWGPWYTDAFGPFDNLQVTAFNTGLRWYAPRWEARGERVLRWFFLQMNTGGGYASVEHDNLLTQGYWIHAGAGLGVNIPLARWWRLRASASYGGAYYSLEKYNGVDITGAPILTGTETGWYRGFTGAEVSLMYILNTKR